MSATAGIASPIAQSLASIFDRNTIVQSPSGDSAQLAIFAAAAVVPGEPCKLTIMGILTGKT
jgi:hypothetical protein